MATRNTAINQQFLEELKSKLHLGSVLFSKSLPSTNDLAIKWLQKGSPNFSLIVANQQTQGKGRSGRKWYTNPDSALAFTLIITDSVLPFHIYNGYTAVSLFQALSGFTENNIQIKWPNDILIEGKKVCGVLIENIWVGGQLDGIIIGVGINISKDSLKINEPLRFPSTYLQEHSINQISRENVLKKVITQFIQNHNLEKREDIVKQWNQKLAYRNQHIQAQRQEGEAVIGKLIGISPEGQLQIQLADSSVVEYNANEIQKFRKQ